MQKMSFVVVFDAACVAGPVAALAVKADVFPTDALCEDAIIANARRRLFANNPFVCDAWPVSITAQPTYMTLDEAFAGVA